MLPLGVPAPWRAEIESWAGALRAAGRSETTIYTRTDHLRRAARALPAGPWEVELEDLLAWTGAQAWSRETRRSVRASLRSFYRWGVSVGRLATSPAEELPPVEPAVPDARPAPETVYREALGLADERGRLILRLAGEVGLRRAEIAQMHSRDLSEDLLGVSLLVHGKGGKKRVVPLPRPLALELRRREPGWIFPGNDNGHLSPRWVGKIATLLLPDGWTLHTLRHRFATKAYASERDLLSVQTLLGHTSPVTTRRYVKLPEDALRRAMLAASS